MKKIKLAPKIMLILLLNMTIILSAVFGYLYLNSQKRDTVNSVAIAKENGMIIQKQLERGLDAARTLAQQLGGFQDYPADASYDIYSTLVQKVAEHNPDWIGVWCSFHTGTSGIDASSSQRFEIYWY